MSLPSTRRILISSQILIHLHPSSVLFYHLFPRCTLTHTSVMALPLIICCFISLCLHLSLSLSPHVWCTLSAFQMWVPSFWGGGGGIGKPNHPLFFFSYTTPPVLLSLSSAASNNSKPALHFLQLPRRTNWLNLGLHRGENIWKDSEWSCGSGSRQAVPWHWIGRNISGATWIHCRICSQAETHTHTPTHTEARSTTLSGGLETVWACTRLCFPK